MENKKGFTLIELLAVIIILGVIMLIAIPSVTRYINESRKNTYIDTARQIVKGAIPLVNSGELDVYDTNTTYYIPASCVPTENSMSSPFGEFVDAYVIVGYTGEGYVYYWASVDSAHQGIEMKEYNKLAKDDVKPNMESVDTTLGIGSRSDIKILDEESCQSFVDGTSSGGNVTYPTGKTKETVVTGDVVTIGTEEFYVIKHDGNDLILLAHYDLNVGNYINPNEQEGIQSNNLFPHYIGNAYYGSVWFSDVNYWKNKVGTYYSGNYCTTIDGVNCAYVYDENSNAYPYINNYKIYLETQGMNIKEARLPSAEEANILKNNNYNAFKEVPYLLGTAHSEWYTLGVTNTGEVYNHSYSSGKIVYGVRPVIVI